MNTQGIGLGLVISDNIVEQFNGKIGCKSRYNHGSTFMFSILLGKDEDYVDKLKVNEPIKFVDNLGTAIKPAPYVSEERNNDLDQQKFENYDFKKEVELAGKNRHLNKNYSNDDYHSSKNIFQYPS